MPRSMDHKRILLVIILNVIIIGMMSSLVCKSTSAVGIGQYSNEKEILFISGSEKVYKFYLFDNAKIHASLEGDLAPYATINDPDPDGPPRNVEVVLKLPYYLEPGIHYLYLTATQATASKSAMGGIASVRTGMRVFALYPFKHPIYNGVGVNDINVNEKGVFGLSVTNQGEEAIEGANGTITILDESNITVAILLTDTKHIEPYQTQSLDATLDTALYGMEKGSYTAIGRVSYDGTDINYTHEAKFIVGEMNVNIVSSTDELIVNATNKYKMVIESDWAGDIKEVYAKITLPDERVVKTPNIDLIKPGNTRKAAGELEAYIETKGMSLGIKKFNIVVYYDSKVTTKEVEVNIIDGIPPKIEKPSIVTTKNVLITLAILIITTVIIYAMVFRKYLSGQGTNQHINDTVIRSAPSQNIRNNQGTNKDTANRNITMSSTGSDHISDNDIRPPTL